MRAKRRPTPTAAKRTDRRVGAQLFGSLIAPSPFLPSWASTDLLVRPPVPALGALDFKSAVPLIETGYRHASEELAKSRLANRFGL
jgi:hypothetical protein